MHLYGPASPGCSRLHARMQIVALSAVRVRPRFTASALSPRAPIGVKIVAPERSLVRHSRAGGCRKTMNRGRRVLVRHSRAGGNPCVRHARASGTSISVDKMPHSRASRAHGCPPSNKRVNRDADTSPSSFPRKRESSAAADLQYTETSLDPRVRGDDGLLRQPRSRE